MPNNENKAKAFDILVNKRVDLYLLRIVYKNNASIERYNHNFKPAYKVTQDEFDFLREMLPEKMVQDNEKYH